MRLQQERPLPAPAGTDSGFAVDAALAPAEVLDAWCHAAAALRRGETIDADRLAFVCVQARVDIATILRLQQAVLHTLLHVPHRCWWRRATARTPALPDSVVPASQVVTARVRTATTAPFAPPSATPDAPAESPKDRVEDLRRQSDWLAKAAERTAGAAGRVSERCGLVVQTSAMAFINIHTATEASVQLAKSIEQVSIELTRTAAASAEASTSADHAASVILELEEAAIQIGSVTDIIRRIATQTNLLALNATIEAARAGDYGRGFAVVANEIKGLAQQTADATGNIGRTVQGVRSAVEAASGRVRGIQRATSEVQQMTSNGAAAIEQQRAATGEISRAMQDASTAVEQMQEGIEDVATKSFDLSMTTEDLLSGVEILNSKAQGL